MRKSALGISNVRKMYVSAKVGVTRTTELEHMPIIRDE